MSVRRVMGTEVEYGISVQGQPSANPMVASSQVVNAYASSTVKARRARWDFEEESPLRDARGFDMARQVADPSQLTDEDLGLANVILTNGARLYVDHAHPEYSSPEVTTPLDVVRWEKAGEQVMLDASRMAAQVPGSRLARRWASSMICSPAFSQSTASSGVVTSGEEYSGCAWSTYSRAPLVRMTFASPRSSSVSWVGSATWRDMSKPRASRSGDSSSKSHRARRARSVADA